MQIKVNLQIFLFIILFVVTHQIELYAWIMLFALIHEFGHLTAGLLLKLKPKSLSFMPLGINITFEAYGYKKLLEKKKIILALAGPLTNFLIAIFITIFHIEQSLKELIGYSNILIGIFNLIPVYPLDGGRILKGIIRSKFSEIKSEEIVNKISNFTIILLTTVSSITILYFKNLAMLLILAYLWIIVIKENRKYSMKKKIYTVLQKTNESIDI